jgi:hypothetical protein
MLTQSTLSAITQEVVRETEYKLDCAQSVLLALDKVAAAVDRITYEDNYKNLLNVVQDYLSAIYEKVLELDKQLER